jgi:predicted neuraminidase
MNSSRQPWPAAIRASLALLALALAFVAWRAAQLPVARAFPGFAVAPSSAPAAEPPFFTAMPINPGSPHAKAHSATLAAMPDGSLRAGWYAGSGEGARDVAIYLSSRAPGGRWTEPRAVLTRESVAASLRRNIISLGNPLLLSDDTGRLGLLFVSIAAGRWSGSSMNLTWSSDGGATWGPAGKLTMNPLANLASLPRNPPSPLVGGGWAVPVYEELLGKFPEILWLQPDGRGGWRDAVSRIDGGVRILQPALVPLDRGRAVAFFRDFRPAKWMSSSRSDDAGRTWTPPVASSLPNRDSGVCVVRLTDGSLLCAFNDISPGKRENLRLALSRDEGVTWRTVATLADEAGVEFSYPYMLAAPDGRIRMVWSARQTEIIYAEFNEVWVFERERKAAP